MRDVVLVLIVTTVACGRVGFDARSGSGSGADSLTSDGPGSVVTDGGVPGSYVVNAAQDTDILENSLSISGNATNLFVGNTAAGSEAVTLLQFDLSAIPSSVTVTSAVLRANVVTTMGTGSITVDVTQVTSAWDEATANSQTRPTWSSAALASNSVPLGTTSEQLFTITGLAQAWNGGSIVNFGIALMAPTAPTSSMAQFASSENTVIAARPQLTIETQ